jgi:hypothetical protein
VRKAAMETHWISIASGRKQKRQAGNAGANAAAA